MNEPHETRSLYWKRYYSEHFQSDELSDSAKSDYSNNRVRHQTYGWMLELAGATHGKTVLDVGCGTGDLARLLTLLGAKVDGVDLAPPTIQRLRQSDPDINWIVGDIGVLPLPELRPAYDLVIATEVLQYSDISVALRGLWDLTAVGGLLVAIVPNANCEIVRTAERRFDGHYSGADPRQLQVLVEQMAPTSRVVRGCTFRVDQSVVPYEVVEAASFAELLELEVQPNRLLFAMKR